MGLRAAFQRVSRFVQELKKRFPRIGLVASIRMTQGKFLGDGDMPSYTDGPGPDDWKSEPLNVGPKPHGFFEPSKSSLLDHDDVRRRRQWRRLLNDLSAPNDVWWARLMRLLND